MSKREAQTIASMNCTGFQQEKMVGEERDELNEIGGNTTIGVLVRLSRKGALKILCPMKKDGKCNRYPDKSHIRRVKCPYESKSEDSKK